MKSYLTAMMEDATTTAEQIITKCAVGGSLFRDSRGEAHAFLCTVIDLQQSMTFFASRSSDHELLTRAHSLMESAMAHLQKELHDLLMSSTTTTDEMDDLRSIVECMVSCGYTKECVKEYSAARLSAVEDGLRRLGYVEMTPSQLQWEAVERRIRNWVGGSRAAVRSLFAGEWSLCDKAFGSSDAIKETVFAEVAAAPAARYLRFAEAASVGTPNAPEKIFAFLDMYDAISELYPEIQSLFSHRSTAAVPSQALASLSKLAGFVRHSLSEFESAIQKDSPKTNVPGGGVHPLTRYVMNYLSLLSDYYKILGDILADEPLHQLKSLPKPFSKLLKSPATTPCSSPPRGGELDDTPPPSPVVSSLVMWLVLLLLGKLDGKAEVYGDAPLSYLFLANNMRYAVHKVRSSSTLRVVLGEEWVKKNEERMRAFVSGYERLGWRRVAAAIPTDVEWLAERGGAVALREKMEEFGAAFEEAYRKQSGWVVNDKCMREELKVSIAAKVMLPYSEFYEKFVAAVGADAAAAAVVRFTPDDIGNYLSDLFYGAPTGSSRGSGSGSGSGSSRSG